MKQGYISYCKKILTIHLADFETQTFLELQIIFT